MPKTILFSVWFICLATNLLANFLPKDFHIHVDEISNLVDAQDKDLAAAANLISNYIKQNPLLLDNASEELFEYLHKATDIHFQLNRNVAFYGENAIKIATKNKIRTLKTAELFFWLGTKASATRKVNKAETYFFQALEFAKSNVSASETFIADIYSKMGLNYIWMGNIEKGLDILRNALNRYNSISGLNKTKLIVVYNNIGIANNNIGNYDKAILNYNNALDILNSTKADFKNTTTLGGTYDHLATPIREKGNYDEALKYLFKGLKIRKKQATGPSNLVSDSYDGMGEVYLLKKEFKVALDYHQKALIIKEKYYKNIHADIAYSYFLMGNVYFDSNQLKLAKNAYTKCISILEKVTTKKYLLYLDTFIRLAKIYKAEGKLQKALSAFEDAIILKNTIKREHQNTNGTLSSLKLKEFKVTEEALEITLDLYNKTKDKIYLKKAFNFFEEKQAGRLLDAMHASSIKEFGGIPAKELSIGDSLKLIISISEKKYFEANKKNKEKEIIENARKDVLLAKEQWYVHTEKIKKNYPEFYNLQLSPDLVSLEEVQNSQKESEAIVEYYVGEKHLYILMVSQQEVSFKKVDYTFSLKESVEKLRRYISSPNNDSKNEIESFIANSNKLFKLLIEPIYSPFLKDKDLCIIADGILGYIPFDVLLFESPQTINGFRSLKYLIKENNISYAYSANLLSKTKQPQKSNKMLAFSPDFNSIVKDSSGNSQFEELKYSIEEVESLDETYNAQVYKGRDASVKNFLEFAPDYNVIHLSTHGQADDRIGDFCYLTFSATNKEKNNYPLYVRDLYNLDLSANMVVLSACETGIGELREGEGIISLGRGFTYAGAKSIISSLWSINDRSTSKIISSFYSYLSQGHKKNHALRKAKLDYLENSTKPNPRYWASFTAYGDMSTIKISEKNDKLYLKNRLFVFIGLFFGGVFIFFSLKK